MVRNIMESTSSAQMVSRGQMHDCNPMHPLENGIVAMVADGIRAPMGYGAQRVTIQANMLMSENINTPCHHLVAGRILPP